MLDVRATSHGDTVANPCDILSWHGVSFSSDTVVADTAILHRVFALNAAGCDSVTSLHLSLRHSSSAVILDTALENDLPRSFLAHSFSSDTSDCRLLTSNHLDCDSLVSYSLHVIWNNRTSLDSTVCQSQLPLLWNHRTFSSAATLMDTLVNSLGSDSIIAMTLHVAPVYDDTVHASICDNQSYAFDGTDYTLPGSYSHLLHTAAFSCDSLRTLVLDVRATSHGDTVANPCDILSWHGVSFSSDTVVADTAILHRVFALNAAGCDSVTSLHLSLRHSSSAVILDTALENDLPRSFLAHSFSSDTSDCRLLTSNHLDCDSLVSYSLHVIWNQLVSLDTSVCSNELPFTWHGKAFASDGTAQLHDTLWLNTAAGSDSTVALTVNVHPVYDMHFYDTICDNETFHFDNDVLTVEGTYNYNYQTHIHGCDSLRTLHLTVHPTYSDIFYDTICQNQSYTWGTPMRSIHLSDSTLIRLAASDTLAPIPSHTTTLDITDTLSSINRCDSLSRLSLCIRPVLDVHFFDTVCHASYNALGWDTVVYPFEGQSFSTTSSYTHHDTFHDTGCDSLRTIHLMVLPAYHQHLFDTIYLGHSITFNGHGQDTPGQYEQAATTTHGCDSIITLHLSVNPVSRYDTTLCRNHLPLSWHGHSFPSANDIVFSGNNHTLVDSIHSPLPDGRDSLTILSLTLLDTSARTDTVLACGNYTWIDSVNYTSPTQIPSLTFTNSLGCDSVVHLDLHLSFSQTIDEYHSPCDSLLWLDGRVFRNDTVGIIDTLHTLSGCDSVIRIHLTVRHSSHTDIADTSCPHAPYSWHTYNIPPDTSGVFRLLNTLPNAVGCDSTITLELFKPGDILFDIDSEVDCLLHGHHVTASATLQPPTSSLLPPTSYLSWSALPTDPLLDSLQQLPDFSFPSGSTILLLPRVPTQYILTAAHSSAGRCADTASITLNPVVTPQVQLKVTPLVLPFGERDFTAYDLDRGHSYARTWYIDDVPQPEQEPALHGQASIGADSIVVTLQLADSICSDTATRVIHVDDLSIYAPNAFTPSQESNNRFVIVTRGVAQGELTIYQRDGLLVYHTDDYTQGWDGRTNDGTHCIQGNYVWKFVYRPELWPSIQRTQVGSILLIR